MKYIKKIIVCLTAAIFIHWAIGLFFKNSLILHSYDKDLDKIVLAPNTIHRHTSEGFATSTIYKHSIVGYNSIQNYGTFIAIWGDSYVESFQVSDKYKIGNVISSESSQVLHHNIIGLNIGFSGRSIADYYFDIPKFENIYKNILCHVIILGGIGDILPDEPTNEHDKFVSNPNFSFVRSNFKPKLTRIKKIISQSKFDFVWSVAKNSLANRHWNFPFIYTSKISKEDSQVKTELRTLDFYRKAWDFLLRELKKQTNKPLIIVYCPSVPIIMDNNVVFQNKDEDLAREFAAKCNRYNIGFVNLEKDFIDFYSNTNSFPRGFNNSRPGFG